MTSTPSITVIVPTHNPRTTSLRRTLHALREQTLSNVAWECLVIDNASNTPLVADAFASEWPHRGQVVRESELGLTAARCRGIAEAKGTILVFVDDDNVLCPTYLATVQNRFAASAELGALGGSSIPEYAKVPPAWIEEFQPLLALRDLGPAPISARWTDSARSYPQCAPIGAGMAVRRELADQYRHAVTGDSRRRRLDRTGRSLSSGGDNDLVLTILEAGYAVAYEPALTLRHLIPAERCVPQYLGPLHRAMNRSWVRVLSMHGIVPWSRIAGATLPLRKARAWLRNRAWAGPAEWIRWQGACGTFEGRAELEEARS